MTFQRDISKENSLVRLGWCSETRSDLRQFVTQVMNQFITTYFTFFFILCVCFALLCFLDRMTMLKRQCLAYKQLINILVTTFGQFLSLPPSPPLLRFDPAS